MESSVEIPGFARLDRVLAPYGVYCLLLAGKVVYVGKSTNIYLRVSRHYSNMQRTLGGKKAYAYSKAIVFDQVVVKFCSRESLDREELELIQRYMPKHNVRLVRPPDLNVLDIPGFREILGRAPRRAGIPPTYKKRKIEPVPLWAK